jgi:hypothetical protein
LSPDFQLISGLVFPEHPSRISLIPLKFLSASADVVEAMEIQSSATSVRRRSSRVSIAFPVEVAGIDLSGNRFSARTKTTSVSRFGCCLPLPRHLRPDQRVRIRRIGTDETAVARVVGEMGSQADEHLYGVETLHSCEGL